MDRAGKMETKQIILASARIVAKNMPPLKTWGKGLRCWRLEEEEGRGGKEDFSDILIGNRCLILITTDGS